MELFELKNHAGLRLLLSDYGARILKLSVPDKYGKETNVHQYYSNHKDYGSVGAFCGPIVGPVANRIKDGLIKIDHDIFQMNQNEHGNSLHSGDLALHNRKWDFQKATPSSASLSLHLSHLADGLPGNRNIKVKYTLGSNDLQIELMATTDRKTAFNFTTHPYLNLEGSSSLEHHEFQLLSDKYTQIDEYKIPTGALLDVGGTPLDFREPNFLANTIVDHNFVLRANTQEHTPVAIVKSHKSGIRLKVFTSLPGLQFCTIQGTHFALEPQYFPDSPRYKHFPSILFEPGRSFDHRVKFEFDTL